MSRSVLATDRAPRAAAATVAAVGLGLGLIWPLVALAVRSTRPFAGRAALSLDGVTQVLADPRTRRVLATTLLQAGWSTAVCLAIGVPLAWGLARGEVPGRRALEVLLSVPFVLPSLVVAAAVLELGGLLGRRGEHPLVAVVAAHALFDVGLVARVVAPALQGGGRLEEAARMLGRGRARAALVTLRLAVPVVAASGVLVFLLSVTSFGVVLALGGDAVTTLEVEIWVRATRLLDLPGAAVLATLQAGVGLVALAVAQRARPLALADDRGAVRRSAGRAAAPRPGPTAVATWVVGLAVVAAPLGALVVGSLRRGDRWTLANYGDLLTAGLPGGGPGLAASLGRSFGFAVVATVVALVVGTAAVVAGGAPGGGLGRPRPGRRGWAGGWRSLATAPLGTSAAVLGLGWLLAFGTTPDLRGTALIVIGAQAVVALPLVVQAVGPALDRVDPRRWEAAAVAGASVARRWTEVVVPMVAPAAVVGAGFAFATALGEVGAVSFVAVDDHATAPIALARLLSRPGEASAGRAVALAVVLAAGAGVAVTLADRVGRPRRRPVR